MRFNHLTSALMERRLVYAAIIHQIMGISSKRRENLRILTKNTYLMPTVLEHSRACTVHVAFARKNAKQTPSIYSMPLNRFNK